MSFFDNLGIGEETQIRNWLDNHNVKNYKLNEDLSIDVNGFLDLRWLDIEELPDYINFQKVSCSFDISFSKLKSDRGFPTTVGMWISNFSDFDEYEEWDNFPLRNYKPVKIFNL